MEINKKIKEKEFNIGMILTNSDSSSTILNVLLSIYHKSPFLPSFLPPPPHLAQVTPLDLHSPVPILLPFGIMSSAAPLTGQVHTA